MREVFIIAWIKSTRGVRRSDGYSIHLSFNDAASYVSSHMSRSPASASHPKTPKDQTKAQVCQVWRYEGDWATDQHFTYAPHQQGLRIEDISGMHARHALAKRVIQSLKYGRIPPLELPVNLQR